MNTHSLVPGLPTVQFFIENKVALIIKQLEGHVPAQSRVATPLSAREGRGLVTFADVTCCTGISFTHIASTKATKVAAL